MSGLVARQRFQFAENDGSAVFFGQAVDLFVEDFHQFQKRVARVGFRGVNLQSGLLETMALQLARAGLDRDPSGNAVQPGGKRAANPERSRLSREDQERGLKRILGIMVVAKHGMADSQDRAPVPDDEGFKCRFIPSGRKPLDKLLVAQASERALLEQFVDWP